MRGNYKTRFCPIEPQGEAAEEDATQRITAALGAAGFDGVEVAPARRPLGELYGESNPRESP